MTFAQQQLALMVAWVLTVGICGVIVSITSGAGWIAVAALALIPPAVAFRLFAAPPLTVPNTIKRPRR